MTALKCVLQVHITQGDYEGRAVIVSWITPSEIGSETVHYGLEKGDYMYSAKGTVTQYTFYNYTSGFIHHCKIENLKVIFHHLITSL